jgi:hypothetical protein
MIALGRHRALAQDAWSELTARAVIEEISADAIAISIPTGSGRLTLATMGWGTVTPVSIRALAARLALVDVDAASPGGRICAGDTRSECVAV